MPSAGFPRPPRARPTGGWGSRPARERCSARVKPPSGSIARRSRRSAGPVFGRSSRAPTCCTGSGCAASAAGRRARTAAHRSRDVHRDRHGGVRRARPGRAGGDRRETRANGPSSTNDDLTAQEAQIARLARDGCQTRRSAPGCSSARAPSSTTCARYSRSSRSVPPPTRAGTGRMVPARARWPYRPPASEPADVYGSVLETVPLSP